MKPFIFFLLQLSLFSLCVAEDKHGTTELGEGNELVIKSGLIVREVAPAEDGKLPLLAVGTADGVHHLYDPNQFAMQGIWTGLFGRLDADGAFQLNTSALRSFYLEKTPPWSFGEKGRKTTDHQWKGYEIRDGKVFFQYDLALEEKGMAWEVEETLEYVSEQLQHVHFSLKPNRESPEYLNYWLQQTHFRRVSTNGQQNQRNLIKNLHPNQTEFTVTYLRRKESPTVPHGYSIEAIEIPTATPPFIFEPTFMDFAPDGTVYVSTRTGGIWKREDGKWSLFADGLNETNGVHVAPDGDGIYVMQRPELTLLRDLDGDGVADSYETIENRYRFTGQYHEFAYGPQMNAKGELFFSTGLASRGYHVVTDTNPNQMTSPLGYRGWVMRHNPDGTLTPFASGLRSPAGIGMNAADELFVTDNQGDWVASSYLSHVEEGDFLGHPASLWDKPEFGLTPAVLDYTNNAAMPESVPKLEKAKFAPTRKRPAVWLSHGDLTNSPGHPSFAPESGFGPFGGQVFIADIAHRNVVRVALEKVGGAYQGAVFPFIRPLKSSSYSTAFDPDGNLWVGSVGRGWTAGDPAIEVIRFNEGETPFEMHRIELTKSGFDVHLTEPLNGDEVALSDIGVTEFHYQYWDGYGSEMKEEAEVPVKALKLSPDRMALSLQLPLKAEFIYQIQLPELKSKSGLTLENNYGIYTLNQLLP